VVVWRDQGREIISGDEDGYVTFWYSKEGNSLYVMKAHTAAITQMRWNEETQQLITCSKDKSVKIWQIPPRWVDESLKRKTTQDEEQEVVPKTDYRTGIEESIWNRFPESPNKQEEEVKREEPKIKATEPVIQEAADESDDEDLMGWAK
jgi:WD40 repeat protein